MNWKRIRDKAVSRLYPEAEEVEELHNTYNEISAYIESEFGYQTFFAGSAGRGTSVKGDRDIDVFVKFPEDTSREKLEKEGLGIGKETFDNFEGSYHVEYAEHPYTKGKINDFEVEIVPCIDTSPGDINTAVDRSPHHAKWVEKHLDDKQKQDVVLLKSFLKSAGLYGSSLKVRGFSGYLCELLIEEYGSLKELTENSCDWGEQKIIDPENHHGDELPKVLEQKFSNDSLIVIDPVDPERNVASVLNSENYAKFIHRCWKFEENPGLNFFEKEEKQLDKFALEQEIEKRSDFLILEFEVIDEPDDIVYPQMRKVMRRLSSELIKNDFRVFEKGFHVGQKIRIFFELESQLPKIEYQKGPKVYHGAKHLDEFTSKYENTFVQEERLVAKIDREFTTAKSLIQEFFSPDVSGLKQQGIPGNVAQKIVDFRMTEPMIEDEEWLKFLAEKLNL